MGMEDVEEQRRASSESALGSRAHIQLTLERARGSIAALRHERVRSELPHGPQTPSDVSSASARVTLALRAQLRASITAYVRRLRRDGATPEQTLVDVKEVVREATPPELAIVESRELMAEVVRWSVETYYESSAREVLPDRDAQSRTL
jgi:hypothetical protein